MRGPLSRGSLKIPLPSRSFAYSSRARQSYGRSWCNDRAFAGHRPPSNHPRPPSNLPPPSSIQKGPGSRPRFRGLDPRHFCILLALPCPARARRLTCAYVRGFASTPRGCRREARCSVRDRSLSITLFKTICKPFVICRNLWPVEESLAEAFPRARCPASARRHVPRKIKSYN